jgi:NADH-quinone oxidoreductase subunit N
VPPLSGFIAKFEVFIVAWNHGLYTLLGFAIFAAVAALYYYLGPVKAMYWSEPLDETPIRLNRATSGVLSVLIFLLIVTGFWAQSISFLVNGSNLSPTVSPSPPVAVIER